MDTGVVGAVYLWYLFMVPDYLMLILMIFFVYLE